MQGYPWRGRGGLEANGGGCGLGAVTGGKGGGSQLGAGSWEKFPSECFPPAQDPEIKWQCFQGPCDHLRSCNDDPRQLTGPLFHPPIHPRPLAQVPSVPGKQSPLSPRSLGCSPPLSPAVLCRRRILSAHLSQTGGASGSHLSLPPLEREPFLSGSFGILGTETDQYSRYLSLMCLTGFAPGLWALRQDCSSSV